jgi:PTS system mannitol-specific IIC component
MVMGPLGGFLIKKIDEALEDKVPSGFEMLVNIFSAGILATILTLLAQVSLAGCGGFTSDGRGRKFLIASSAPPADLIIEPAKVLFLNNINHGILARSVIRL